jgi:peptidyl-dipeptidase A
MDFSGNMWAQTWNNIESFTRPYPDKKEIDITQAMKEQNYTAIKMFQMSDEFFKSLNLTAMPEKFWKNSIIEKPTDREIVCHASAWDFYDGEDFRYRIILVSKLLFQRSFIMSCYLVMKLTTSA